MYLQTNQQGMSELLLIIWSKLYVLLFHLVPLLLMFLAMFIIMLG